ncbi:MAG: hypothetical protein ACRC8P_03125 [Spiroplasma sp.]
MEKKQQFNPIIHYFMISSLLIIFLTLLISWFLWFFHYQNIVESMLINFSFLKFNIIILIFSVLTLFCALALFIVAKKNTYNKFFSLLGFALSLTIETTSLFLYSNFKSTNNFLIVFLPWIITIIAATILFIASGINLINNENNFNKNQKTKVITKQPENNDNLINKAKNEKLSINNEAKTSDLVTKDWNWKDFSSLTFSSEENNQVKNPLIETKNNNQSSTMTVKWTKKQIKQIWETAEIIPGVNKDLYRKDYAGAWMFFSAFITNPTEAVHHFRSYSWIIVNHKPLSQEGTNNVENLKAMNIVNALSKGENYPKWKTKVSSCGNENIIKEQIWSD